MATSSQRIKRLIPFFASSRWGLVVAGIATLIGAATEPLVPVLMKPLLDKGFVPGGIPLWLIPLVIVGLFATRGVAGYVATYTLSWSANNAIVALRRAMFMRVMAADPTLFTGTTASSLTNTLTYEVQNGAQSLVNTLLGLVKDSLTLIALLVYLFWINWQLTLFVGVLFPSVAFVMRTMSKRLHRLTVEGQDATDQLAYVVEENVAAWRIVRLHGATPSQMARFEKVSNRLRRLSVKAVAAGAAMTPITQILTAAALSAVVVMAVWQSGTQGGSVGGFVAFLTAMLMLVQPIKHLSEAAGPVTRGLDALERCIALIDDTPVEHGGSFDPGRARGELELRGVTLQYPKAATPALDHVDLTLHAGESVALVGPSGAGKSTLVNLLPRFIEPTSGTLLLEGKPLAEWDMAALRRQFALVSQDVILFNDTVAANVSLDADPTRPEVAQRVREALQGANLLDFVESLPQGIEHMVGHNGGQLSGGQRQRMAIARAIYKDAPILILDEATSALDSESERLVQQALERLMKGRTSLVIAHRLSTIEGVDRIVTLDGGRVVEQGSHA
ncbi:MAG: lipid export permease/ATP-binding protein MsbA, partial [Rhizobacter sp.]|nr:lipid export permease/ATP-binding protein MsbA [Rhizobacter sp.]